MNIKKISNLCFKISISRRASGQEVIWSHAESLWKIVNEVIWKVPKELCKYFVQPIRGQELSVRRQLS